MADVAIFVIIPSFGGTFWIANPFRNLAKMWIKTRTKN